MRYSKSVLTAIVVLMILSLNFTPAGAQSDEPDSQVNAAPPVPVFPTDDFTFRLTPIFQFTEDPLAIKYEIKVSNYTTGVLLYSFKGAPNCSPGGICSLAPTYELSPAIQSELKGYYSWVVRSKYGDGNWSSPSAPAGFVVLKKGVYSTFDTVDNKWASVNCEWSVTSRGYWKTNGGLLHKLCSSTEKHLFTSLVPSLGLVYEVRFKRKVEISSANNLYFLGDPADLSASGEWNDGYQFIFSYDDWVLAKRVNGSSSLIASGDFAYPYSDWVTLTVWRDGAKIYLFVDGLLLDEFTDGTITYGYVGIGMVESVADVSPLLVDYVKVYYSSTPPYTWY